MVLWEITLATAYVLGLRRTYRLALRGQRRLLGTKYPKIREFTERSVPLLYESLLIPLLIAFDFLIIWTFVNMKHLMTDHGS